MHRVHRTLSIFLSGAAIAATDARAQQPYPTKPIRLVIGFLAGGPTDIVARTMTPKLAELLGQPIIIDNRPGAGGAIGTEHVAKSAPVGYTLLMGTIGGLAVAPSLNAKLGYDTLRDLAPITQTVTITSILVVPAGGAKSLRELIDTGPGPSASDAWRWSSPVVNRA